MPNLTFGTDSASYTSIPGSTTPYNIGSPLALGGSRIVESITLDLGTTGVTSPANASAAIWSGSSPYGIIYRSANLSMTNSNRYRTFDVGANGLYLGNATYYFGVSRASSSYRISVGQQSSTTGVSRTSGDQAVGSTSLGTLNNSMSSRRLTGYITYRDATVPDEPFFTIRQGYGSVIIEDISTATDPALPLTQWQYYRYPGSGSWTNVTVSGDTLDEGNGTFTLTGLSAGTDYSIYLRVYNAHGVSPQTLPEIATPYGLPFMVEQSAEYDPDTNVVIVSFTGNENYDEEEIDYYHIYRSVNGGAYSYIRQTDETETLEEIYIDTAVSLGNTYTYRIYPHNRAGFGGYGQTAGVTPVEVPGPVGSLSANNIGPTSIGLSWIAPTNNGGDPIDSYTLFIQKEAGTGGVAQEIDLSVSSIVVDGEGDGASTFYLHLNCSTLEDLLVDNTTYTALELQDEETFSLAVADFFMGKKIKFINSGTETNLYSTSLNVSLASLANTFITIEGADIYASSLFEIDNDLPTSEYSETAYTVASGNVVLEFYGESNLFFNASDETIVSGSGGYPSGTKVVLYVPGTATPAINDIIDDAISPSATTYTITEWINDLSETVSLHPNQTYTIGIYAVNSAGDGEQSTIVVKTIGGLPRVYNSLTDTWDYAILKHYDDIASEWKTISIYTWSDAEAAWVAHNT